MRLLAFSLLVLSILCNLFSQNSNLYIPLNIKQTYTKNTRSDDGNPGSEYWQNRADYNICVSLDPQNAGLKGTEKIVYFNNSPDSLKELVIHLFPNIYKKGNSREFVIDSTDAGYGVVLDEFFINNTVIEFNDSTSRVEYLHNDFQVNLEEPLCPGKQLSLSLSWHYKINRKSHMRTGKVDSSSYFIAYFFPRIAVYDDIDGWNRNKYSGIAEFYNDFGSFNVKITVPGDYIVWATGTLQNAKEVLSANYYQRFTAAQAADTVIHVIDSTNYLSENRTISEDKNIWHFKAESVTDFAFATSDHYMWDATSLIVDEKTNRRVVIEAAYNKNSADFYEVAAIARKAVDYMSNQFPGLPFPFPNMTVFNGLDEMEYPMMVNDKTVDNSSYLIKLTSHEISHSYFPFYMGINETKYGWMDEGWACYIDYQICSSLDSKENANIFYMARYEELQGNELDLPIISPSIYLKRPVYHLNTYAKSATFLFILRNQLGDDLFKKVLHEFVRRWNGKHPTPYDFFFTINDVSKQELSWLIRPWFFEFGFVDLAIDSVIKTNQEYEIIIEKIGKYPAPVNVEITYDDNSVEWVRQSVSVWSEDKTTFKIRIPMTRKIHSVELSDLIIPDADMTNNYYEMN